MDCSAANPPDALLRDRDSLRHDLAQMPAGGMPISKAQGADFLSPGPD